MKAVEISQFGPPDVLTIVERPDPFPAEGEILIDVQAAGVNRPDIVQRATTRSSWRASAWNSQRRSA